MLSNSKLTKSYWAESTSTTCLSINIFPSHALDKKTLHEVWSGTLGNYSYLNIFGCLNYALVNNGKQELRFLKCVFLSFKADIKGYRL